MKSQRFFLSRNSFRFSGGLLLAGTLAVLPLSWAAAQQPAPAPTEQPAAAPPAVAAEAPKPVPVPTAEPGTAVPTPAPTEQPAQPAAEQPAAAAAEHPATPAPEAANPVAGHVEAAAEVAGKAGQPEGGVHEGVHEGQHEHGPLIENWWSWDYTGPNRTHHNPPFGFALINFVVFLFLLNKLAGKDFREFVISRHTDVRKALDRARQVEAKAQEQLRHFEERTKSVDTEIKDLLTGLRTAAEAERHNIIARAEAEAQKLLRDAESQVQVALDAAKRDLEQKAGLLAVELAEKLITANITDADQHRLVDRYVAQVESLGAKASPNLEGRP
jgi:F0F1-type ATP synthase membrane subunit b/b'